MEIQFSIDGILTKLQLSPSNGHLALKVCLPLKIVLHQRLSSIGGHLPSKVVSHQRSSSSKGHLPSKGQLRSKVVFNQMSSSIKCHLQSNVVFYQMLSSIKRGCCIRSPLATKLFEVVLLHEDITQRDLKNSSPWCDKSVHHVLVISVHYF